MNMISFLKTLITTDLDPLYLKKPYTILFQGLFRFHTSGVQNELEYSNFTSSNNFAFLACEWSLFCALVLCTHVCPFTAHLQLCTSLNSRVEKSWWLKLF